MCSALQGHPHKRDTRPTKVNYHEGNTAWTAQHENNMSEVQANIQEWRQRAIITCKYYIEVRADVVWRFQSINSCLMIILQGRNMLQQQFTINLIVQADNI
jgi:hypothetical protein